MILLDTNICIYIINAKPAEVLNRFQEYRMGEIGLCSVVAAELAFGVAKSGSARNRQALEMFLAPKVGEGLSPFTLRLESSTQLMLRYSAVSHRMTAMD